MFSDFHLFGDLSKYSRGGIRDEKIVRIIASTIAKGISEMHKVKYVSFYQFNKYECNGRSDNNEITIVTC